jgi:hypothetical protein
MKKSYKLSDVVIPGDKISENIYRRRKVLYYDIKNFSGVSSKANDGTYAENIIRIVFGGGNLNHLNRNYAHFDVAIDDGIDGFVKDDEIISIKSTYNYKSIPNILKNTEAIKLNSVFSYVLGAISNFTFVNDRNNFSTKNLIDVGIEISKKYKNVDFKKVINVTLYYLIFKNNRNELDNYSSDINSILSKKEDLIYGTYIDYNLKVEKEVDKLDSPISIGTVHIDNKNLDDITCVINKTNTIPLKNYWYDLVKIWSDKKYYLKPIKSQYLTYEDISKLFNLNKNYFPIQINISIGSYTVADINDSEEDKLKNNKERNRNRISKLKTAAKLNDADFGKYNNEIVKTFNDMIDDLEENPSKILKYQEFIKK